MAGYGGLGNEIAGVLGMNPTRGIDPGVPSAIKVGKNYRNLLNAYLGSAGDIYANEATYQPLYTQLGLNNRQMAIDSVGRAAPGIMATQRGYNPQVTSLLDTLGAQASDQLGQNGGLDPAMQRRLTQNVRGAQAARGLGYGPADAAQENYYLTNTMEQRRQANQQFAGNVGQMQEQYYKDPFSVVAGVGAPSAAPTIIPSGQSDAMLGTAYNARAASQIAAANNMAASENAY